MSFEILSLFSFSLVLSRMDIEGLEDDDDAELAMVLVVALACGLLFIMVELEFSSLKVYMGEW